MKTRVLRSLAAITFALILPLAAVYGQRQMKFDVPFDFYLNGHQFAAGEYVVERVSRHTNDASLSFRATRGKLRIEIMLPMTENHLRADALPSVIFRRYGSVYFLSELLDPVGNFAAQARRSKVEKDLAQRARGAKETVMASMMKK